MQEDSKVRDLSEKKCATEIVKVSNRDEYFKRVHEAILLSSVVDVKWVYGDGLQSHFQFSYDIPRGSLVVGFDCLICLMNSRASLMADKRINLDTRRCLLIFIIKSIYAHMIEEIATCEIKRVEEAIEQKPRNDSNSSEKQQLYQLYRNMQDWSKIIETAVNYSAVDHSNADPNSWGPIHPSIHGCLDVAIDNMLPVFENMHTVLSPKELDRLTLSTILIRFCNILKRGHSSEPLHATKGVSLVSHELQSLACRAVKECISAGQVQHIMKYKIVDGEENFKRTPLDHRFLDAAAAINQKVNNFNAVCQGIMDSGPHLTKQSILHLLEEWEKLSAGAGGSLGSVCQETGMPDYNGSVERIISEMFSSFTPPDERLAKIINYYNEVKRLTEDGSRVRVDGPDLMLGLLKYVAASEEGEGLLVALAEKVKLLDLLLICFPKILSFPSVLRADGPDLMLGILKYVAASEEGEGLLVTLAEKVKLLDLLLIYLDILLFNSVDVHVANLYFQAIYKIVVKDPAVNAGGTYWLNCRNLTSLVRLLILIPFLEQVELLALGCKIIDALAESCVNALVSGEDLLDTKLRVDNAKIYLHLEHDARVSKDTNTYIEGEGSTESKIKSEEGHDTNDRLGVKNLVEQHMAGLWRDMRYTPSGPSSPSFLSNGS